MSPQRDGKPKRAILVSTVPGEHSIRVSLDDVVSEAQVPRGWSQREHITSKEFSRESLKKMEFDDKELADFGHYILARLSAFIDRGEG